MSTTQHLLLSPAELAYLHSTLNLTPPLRPDGRSAKQFRPLTAETGILPGTNGSARVCFADGTEAVVGAKAEVEKTVGVLGGLFEDGNENEDSESRPRPKRLQKRQKAKTGSKSKDEEEGGGKEEGGGEGEDDYEAYRRGENDWVELTVEVPGYRDDDSATVFLATMLSEALLADGELTKKLWINRRFHWKLYLDIILISPPLSYPLPLLSLTTHLALLATRLPRLKSEGDEDPMFDDDWAASRFIYPSRSGDPSSSLSRPPITLLVMAVGNNIIFDPSKEELAVADCALAVSVGERGSQKGIGEEDDSMDADSKTREPGHGDLRLVSVRTIDPPSRLTAPGVPNSVNAVEWGISSTGDKGAAAIKKGKEVSRAAATVAETGDVEGVWKAPRGGSKIALLGMMVQKVLEKGGVADEVLEGLDGVELA
ncbi:hypothetical protein F5Y16DRAFT_337339 [Xylariaceae sp. FL0255]|nr:hypothetical protein F5Y16DRAFT_337339 [Xylariaceae sp. FL0255]